MPLVIVVELRVISYICIIHFEIIYTIFITFYMLIIIHYIVLNANHN